MTKVERHMHGYAWEKSYLAVRGMAASTRSVQQRVGDAYVYHLTHIRAENVPPEIYSRIETVARRVTCEPAQGDEGTVAATVAKMSDDEAHALANEIVDIYDNIARQYEF